MKTLRELLFEQHRAAEPKLDALRQQALAQPRPAPGPPSGETGQLSWLDVIRSLRWHLVGMGALWLLAAVLNAASAATPAETATAQPTLSPAQLASAVREHRRQLTELVGVQAADPVPPPPRRSERPVQTAFV